MERNITLISLSKIHEGCATPQEIDELYTHPRIINNIGRGNLTPWSENQLALELARHDHLKIKFFGPPHRVPKPHRLLLSP